MNDYEELLKEVLAKKEQDGTLVNWVKENHPDMLLPDGTVAKFQLIQKLGL